MVIKRFVCRDVARYVSTIIVQIIQQHGQRAVGPLPHKAVDGLQLGGRDDCWRRDKSRLYKIVAMLGAGGKGQHYHNPYPSNTFHARKFRKTFAVFHKMFTFVPST